MAKSKIEWTEKVWNPVTGCTKVSPGCEHCYAMRQAFRLEHMGQKDYAGTAHKTAGGKIVWTGKVNILRHKLEYPLHIKKPTKFFVNSMSDLFHEKVPFEFIDKVYQAMAQCPQHIFQILTKRPERALAYYKWFGKKVKEAGFDSVPAQSDNELDYFLPDNIWFGVSVENQETADERIPILLQIPATVRWLSCEPLLGAVDIQTYLHDSNCLIKKTYECNCSEPREVCIDWIVAGGESGPGARPMHPDWVRKIRDECNVAGVPFFFKQWGEWVNDYSDHCDTTNQKMIYSNEEGDYPVWMRKVGKHSSGRLLDGVEWNGYPI